MYGPRERLVALGFFHVAIAVMGCSLGSYGLIAEESSKLCLEIAGAMMLAQAILLSFWIATGESSAFRRWTAPFFAASFVISVYVGTTFFYAEWTQQTVNWLALAVVAVGMYLGSTLTFFGYAVVHKVVFCMVIAKHHNRPGRGESYRFSIRDLLVLTAFAASALGLLRLSNLNGLVVVVIMTGLCWLLVPACLRKHKPLIPVLGVMTLHLGLRVATYPAVWYGKFAVVWQQPWEFLGYTGLGMAFAGIVAITLLVLRSEGYRIDYQPWFERRLSVHPCLARIFRNGS